MTRQRPGIALFALVAYVLTGLLLEAAHHDAMTLSPGGRPAVASHDCGSKEIHVPPGEIHQCLACLQTSQRISTPAQSFVFHADLALRPEVAPSLDERFLSTDYLFSGKRGPP